MFNSITLSALAYFLVCGGPFGTEELMRTVPYPLVVLCGLIVFPLVYSLPLALVCSELATAMPYNSGITMWVKEAFGHFLGFQVGFCVLITYMLDTSSYPLLFLSYIEHSTSLVHFEPWALWLIGTALTVVMSLLHLIGLRAIAWSSVILVALVFIPCSLFVIFAFPFVDPSVWFSTSGRSSASSVVTLLSSLQEQQLQADYSYFLSLLIWHHSGWLSISFLAGEIRAVRTTYPRTMLFTVILSILTTIVPLAMLMCVDRTHASYQFGAQWVHAATEITTGGVVGSTNISWLGVLMIIAAMASAIGLFNAQFAASTRGLAHMSAPQMNMLPHVFYYSSYHHLKQQMTKSCGQTYCCCCCSWNRKQEEEQAIIATPPQQDDTVSPPSPNQQYSPSLYNNSQGVPIVAIGVQTVLTSLCLLIPMDLLISAQMCIDSVSVIILLLSFIYLRFRRQDLQRPFRIPLNNLLSMFLCIFPICI